MRRTGVIVGVSIATTVSTANELRMQLTHRFPGVTIDWRPPPSSTRATPITRHRPPRTRRSHTSSGIVEAWLCDTEGSHPDMLIITPDSYRTFRHHREIADRIMADLGYTPDQTVEVRVAEGCTEVDWYWQHDGEIDWSNLRTTVIEAKP